MAKKKRIHSFVPPEPLTPEEVKELKEAFRQGLAYESENLKRIEREREEWLNSPRHQKILASIERDKGKTLEEMKRELGVEGWTYEQMITPRKK
ncbi:MAG: hypothetical protein LIP09_12250 [Bacteroidales bacterium]|nr:hypothetical protein [Bacteroidales bacterium]